MKCLGRDIVRVRGALVVELADGSEGAIDVDLDVSDPRNEWGMHIDYADSPTTVALSFPRRISTTWFLRIHDLDLEAPFVIRMPAHGGE